MYRLIIALVMVGASLLLAGCGSGSGKDMDAQSSGTSLAVDYEQAYLGGTTPVPSGISQALQPLQLPSDIQLPALPGGGLPERLPSQFQQDQLNGTDTFDRSENTSANTPVLSLDSTDGQISWAIYQFSGLSVSSTQLQKLTVNTANGLFTGDQPGYWVGLANYSEDRWQAIAQTTSALYNKTFSPTTDYFSDAGNLYVFVLVTGAQEVDINDVTLEHETIEWNHIEFGEGADNAGWTPALAFSLGSVLMVTYSDYNTGKARFGAWNRETAFDQSFSWDFMDVDPLREDTPDVFGSTCKHLDMVVDPESGHPRISLVYDGVTGGDENSLIGLSVYVQGATALFLNYRLGGSETGGIAFADTAGYTSLDRNPVTGEYAVANLAENTNTPWEPANDMQLRTFQVNDPKDASDDEPVKRTKNFAAEEFWGIPCYNPHLRYLPDQHFAVSVNGGYMYELYQDGADWVYVDYAQDQNSTQFGSVAYNDEQAWWGYSYVRDDGSDMILRFIEDLDNPSSQVHEIETVTDGWIGTSQLAYRSDGTPGVAYTVGNGTSVDVKLAEYNGSSWDIETISTAPCVPEDASDMLSVIVDLDYDLLDNPALIWNQVDGTSCKAHVAMRGV